MTDLSSVIAKLEKAEAGSRELDAEIQWRVLGRVAGDYTPPHYTTSLDAALTLVPEEWFTKLDQYVLSDQPHGNRWRVWLNRYDPINEVFSGARESPALALCIAALKARSTP